MKGKIKFFLLIAAVVVFLGIGFSGGYLIASLSTTQEEYWSVEVNDNVIWIRGMINTKMSEKVVKAIYALAENSRYSYVEIRIDSDGGDMFAALEICDAFKVCHNRYNKEVRTVVTGQAFSAGVLILSAGTKGQRYVNRHSMTMIHDPWYAYRNFQINRKSLNDAMKEYETFAWQVYLFLSANTGQDVEKIKADCYGETWLTAEDTIRYGLADRYWE